jgi:hypothetical protein
MVLGCVRNEQAMEGSQ